MEGTSEASLLERARHVSALPLSPAKKKELRDKLIQKALQLPKDTAFRVLLSFQGMGLIDQDLYDRCVEHLLFSDEVVELTSPAAPVSTPFHPQPPPTNLTSPIAHPSPIPLLTSSTAQAKPIPPPTLNPPVPLLNIEEASAQNDDIILMETISQNIDQFSTEELVYKEVNVNCPINEEPMQHLGKAEKNTGFIWNVVKSFEKGYDENVEKFLETAESVIEVLIQLMDLLLPALVLFPNIPTRPFHKLKDVLIKLKGLAKNKAKVKVGLKKVIQWSLALFSTCVLVFKHHHQLRRFDVELEKGMAAFKSAISPDILKCIAAIGGSAAAFLVGANALLAIAGFGAQGIVAGSLAAGAMGAAVQAGGWFAFFQSAGVVGFSAVASGGILAAGAVVGAGVVVVVKLVEAHKNKRQKISMAPNNPQPNP